LTKAKVRAGKDENPGVSLLEKTHQRIRPAAHRIYSNARALALVRPLFWAVICRQIPSSSITLVADGTRRAASDKHVALGVSRNCKSEELLRG
jgi:hypothetical protein